MERRGKKPVPPPMLFTSWLVCCLEMDRICIFPDTADKEYHSTKEVFFTKILSFC